LRVKRPGREADHSPPSSAKVKKGRSYSLLSMTHKPPWWVQGYSCPCTIQYMLACYSNLRRPTTVVNTVFARVICALFFSILATEKSGCVKYADFFCGGLDLGVILV
jgi:hypothetical protein